MGFERRELAILLASGAGAGIAASFNAPIAGGMFAMEIILREFELRVFSPIILAAVTGTIVGRGVMGSAPMLERIGYQLVSGWEILFYAGLGLLVGVLAFAFVRLLHQSEGFFQGHHPSGLSRFLGRQPLYRRAAMGGLVVGLFALMNPAVWGTGHEFVNRATLNEYGLGFLAGACILKLFGTAVTLGSGGSGGTFFPIMVIGAMAGGVFGDIVHALFPTSTAPSGAYAMVGIGGAIAALTRGPLTGMMMLYELSGNYAIILPLMVCCTIASALCHYLLERKAPKVETDDQLLRKTTVSELMTPAIPLASTARLDVVANQLFVSQEGVLPVHDAQGRILGVIQADQLREYWRNEARTADLLASDVMRRLPVVTPEKDVASALELKNDKDVDALPVMNGVTGGGVITRSQIRRFLRRARHKVHEGGEAPIAATEV
jgi:CIC family chloride channel protein